MKIDKAIYLLNETFHHSCFSADQDVRDAINLGAEALKLIAQEPSEGYTCIPRPLPGETKE